METRDGIKNFRNRMRFNTQKDLADVLDVDQTSISIWESGKGFPGFQVAKKLLELGATVEEIFGVEYEKAQNLVKIDSIKQNISESELEDKIKKIAEAEIEKSIKPLEGILKSNIRISFRESIQNHLASAEKSIKIDWLAHFINLENVFEILSKIDLCKEDYPTLRTVIRFSTSYKRDLKNIWGYNGAFLKSFLKFKKHCESSNNNDNVLIFSANELHDILRKLFGGDRGILSTISMFGSLSTEEIELLELKEKLYELHKHHLPKE